MAKYIGNRCIPINVGEHNKKNEYESLVVVLDKSTGNSYTSKKAVPVGIELSNTEYWALSSIYSQQMDSLNKNVEDVISKTEDVLENKIPTDIVKAAVDTYVEANSGGFATLEEMDAAEESILEIKSALNKSTGGMSYEEKNILLNILRLGVFTEDVTDKLDQLETLFSDVMLYTVINTLTNVTSSNSATKVEDGTAYIANLTATSGYEIQKVTVTMGGIDVTSKYYSNGTISIISVTGNIVISATATKVNDNLIKLSECGVGTLLDGTSADGVAKLCTPLIPVTPNTTYKTNLTRYLQDGTTQTWINKLCWMSDKTTMISVKAMQDNTTLARDTSPSNVAYVKIVFDSKYTNPYFGISGEVE